jgi:hypothetical protein
VIVDCTRELRHFATTHRQLSSVVRNSTNPSSPLVCTISSTVSENNNPPQQSLSVSVIAGRLSSSAIWTPSSNTQASNDGVPSKLLNTTKIALIYPERSSLAFRTGLGPLRAALKVGSPVKVTLMKRTGHPTYCNADLESIIFVNWLTQQVWEGHIRVHIVKSLFVDSQRMHVALYVV